MLYSKYTSLFKGKKEKEKSHFGHCSYGSCFKVESGFSFYPGFFPVGAFEMVKLFALLLTLFEKIPEKRGKKKDC